MMALAFSGFNFILHLAQYFANLRRSSRKSFAANCTFLLAAHTTVSSANWDFLSFVCGEVLVSHGGISGQVMGSEQTL